MAVTTSEKFNFPMATSGSDPAPNRAAWMAIFDSLEDNALALGYGPLQDRPATPAKPVAWFDTVNARLSIHTGTGGTWTDVSAPLGDTPTAMAYNAAGAEGVSNRAARADHKHALPAITRGDLPAITDSDLPTVPVAKGGTGATTLASGSFLRGNGTGAIQTRTPAEVRSDISAAPASRGLPDGGNDGDVLKRTSGGYAWGSGTVTSDSITDATTIGKSLIKAVNAAAARSAIGAGTSSFDGSYSALTGKPSIPSQASDVGAVPTGRKINGKTLTTDITLVPADLGAVDTLIKAQGTKSGAVTLDLAAGPNHVLTINGDTVLSLAGISGSGRMHQIRLFISQSGAPAFSGHGVTWPAGTVWPEGEPKLTSGPDEIVFTTVDGGSTVLGFHVASYGQLMMPSLGDAALGGFFSGFMDTTKGNIIVGDASQVGARYALIVSPKSIEAPAGKKWKTSQDAGPAATKTRWDGLSATIAMVNAGAAYEAAAHCNSQSYDSGDGGSQWYLPAMDELELIYRNLRGTSETNYTSAPSTGDFPPAGQLPGGVQPPGYNPSADPNGAAYTSVSPGQTSVAAFKNGGAQALGANGSNIYYWASTEYNATIAWFQFFSGSTAGIQNYSTKTSTALLVRPVRRLLL